MIGSMAVATRYGLEGWRALRARGFQLDVTELPTPTSPILAPRGDLGLQEHYINGRFRPSASGATFETLNPATNEVLARAADGREEDVAAAVAAARHAFDEGPWPRMTATERAAVLRRIAACIREHADEFIAREVADIGMPMAQMQGLAARAAQNFDYYAGVVTELHGRSFQVGDEFLNYTIRKPVGVAGLIMPWNAPLMLSTWRIAPALAAGNTVVLKPAEWSPLTATPLASALEEAGVPAGVFNVVHGFGETAGAPLSAHPGVDLICFTGETATGQTIIAAGAPTLEALVGRAGRQVAGRGVRRRRCRTVRRCRARADLHHERPALHRGLAVARPGVGCTTGSSKRSPNGRATSGSVTRSTRGPSSARSSIPSTTRACSTTSHRRVTEGARVLAGGGRPEHLPDGNFLEATVIADVDETMRVFQEEIFGPVLVAMPFRDEADADPPGQRHAVRPGRLRLDERPAASAPRRAGDRHGHVLGQLAERARPAHAVRRREGQRHRP